MSQKQTYRKDNSKWLDKTKNKMGIFFLNITLRQVTHNSSLTPDVRDKMDSWLRKLSKQTALEGDSIKYERVSSFLPDFIKLVAIGRIWCFSPVVTGVQTAQQSVWFQQVPSWAKKELFKGFHMRWIITPTWQTLRRRTLRWWRCWHRWRWRPWSSPSWYSNSSGNRRRGARCCRLLRNDKWGPTMTLYITQHLPSTYLFSLTHTLGLLQGGGGWRGLLHAAGHKGVASPIAGSTRGRWIVR